MLTYFIFYQREWQIYLGTSTFSEVIGLLTASQSCWQNSCFSACVHALNDGISNWWLSSAVLCRAALRRTRVVDECNAIFIRSYSDSMQFCPDSSCLVLGVGPSEWLLWLWALQWVFIIHLEWIWSLKHITRSCNRIDITAIFIFISRPTSPVSLTVVTQYIGAYADQHKKSG